MKKTLLYLALLILIGGGVYFLIFDKNENPFGEGETSFSIKDTAAIQTIYMVRNSGQSILLERKPEGWTVNNRYPSLKSTTQILLNTLYGQRAQYPIPENQHNSTITGMAGGNIKVEVYDKDRKKMTTFYVGGEGPDAQGTIMLTEGAKTAYVITMPGLTGVLNPRYSTNIEDWRDRSVFRSSPQNIRSVSVSYPLHPLNSFTITQQDSKLSMATKEDISAGKPLNQKRASSYLKFFEEINMEGYANGQHLDTLLPRMPLFSVMELITADGKKQHVDIYYRPIDKRSKNYLRADDDIPDDYDADRFYAVLNNYKDTAVIQNFVFQKLLRKAYEFYEPDAPVAPEKPSAATTKP